MSCRHSRARRRPGSRAGLREAVREATAYWWLWLVAGIAWIVVSLIMDPTATFAAVVAMVGFLFGLVGVWWMIEAFLERPLNPLWWTGLIPGVLMTGLAFSMAGQLFSQKAYLLLDYAGLWGLMQGITHIAHAWIT